MNLGEKIVRNIESNGNNQMYKKKEKKEKGGLVAHSVKCFCLSALCLSSIVLSKSPKASLIQGISEHK